MAVLLLTGRVHRVLAPLVERVAQARAAGRRCVLIVPEQYTLQAEVELMERLHLSGFFDIEVLSPTRLRTRVFERAGSPDRVMIDERGKQMVLGDVIFREKDQLSYYKGAAELNGFAQRMGALIADLKRGGLTPDQVASLGEQAGARTLALKFADTARVFAAYEERLEGRFVDGEDVQREMLARMEASGYLKDAAVFVYGFDMITPQFAQELLRIAQVSAGLTLALETDRSGCRDAALYGAVNRSLARLEKLLEDAQMPFVHTAVDAPLDAPAEICALERELYAMPIQPFADAVRRVRLLSAATPYAEVHEAAARLRLLALEKHIDFADMAAVYPDEATYAPLIRAVFPLYDIPFTLHEKRPAAHHPLIRFLLSALRAVTRGYEARDVIDCARTMYAGLTQAECDALENYAIAYGLRGGTWKRPLRYGDEAEIAQLEPVRARLIDPLAALGDALAHALDADDTVRAVMAYLESVQAADTLESDRERLRAAGLMDAAADCAQVWNRLMETLDQLHTLLAGRRGGTQSVVRMLTGGLEALELSELPQDAGAMMCGALGNVRLGDVKALFLLGANDGMGVSQSASLLEDAERRAVTEQSGAYLGMSDEERLALTRLDVLKALSEPHQLLHVSYAVSSENGAALRPALVVDRLRRVFPQLQLEGGALRTGEDAALCAPRAALSGIAPALRTAMEEGADALDDRWRTAYAYLAHEDGARGELSRTVERLYEKRRPAQLSPATARVLYGKRTISVSRLERFAACPYQHFVRYGLRPQEKREYGVDRAEVGEVYHQAIDAFTRAAMEEEAWPNIERARCDAMMDAVCAPLIEQWAKTPLGESARGRAAGERMRRTARRAGWAITSQMQSSGFRPDRTEAVFGKGAIPPVHVQLPDGSEVYLQGRIDRIDLYDADEALYLRVVDYKSGKKEIDPTDVYWGLQLQLLIYLYAALALYPGAQAAGLFYCRVDDPMVRSDSRIAAEVERKIARELRLKGVTLADVQIIRQHGAEIADTAIKKDGTLSSRAQAVDAQQLALLCDYAAHLAAHLSERIRSGEIAASPAEKEHYRACAFCDYQDICGFERALGDRTRRLEKKTLDDAAQLEREARGEECE